MHRNKKRMMVWFCLIGITVFTAIFTYSGKKKERNLKNPSFLSNNEGIGDLSKKGAIFLPTGKKFTELMQIPPDHERNMVLSDNFLIGDYLCLGFIDFLEKDEFGKRQYAFAKDNPYVAARIPQDAEGGMVYEHTFDIKAAVDFERAKISQAHKTHYPL